MEALVPRSFSNLENWEYFQLLLLMLDLLQALPFVVLVHR